MLNFSYLHCDKTIRQFIGQNMLLYNLYMQYVMMSNVSYMQRGFFSVRFVFNKNDQTNKHHLFTSWKGNLRSRLIPFDDIFHFCANATLTVTITRSTVSSRNVIQRLCLQWKELYDLWLRRFCHLLVSRSCCQLHLCFDSICLMRFHWLLNSLLGLCKQPPTYRSPRGPQLSYVVGLATFEY